MTSLIELVLKVLYHISGFILLTDALYLLLLVFYVNEVGVIVLFICNAVWRYQPSVRCAVEGFGEVAEQPSPIQTVWVSKCLVFFSF